MRYKLFTLGLLLTAQNIWGQINKAEKLLKAGDTEGAITAYKKDLSRLSKVPIVYTALSKIYADSTQETYNLKEAYTSIIGAQEGLKSLSSKEKAKLRKQKISSFYLKNTEQKLLLQVLDLVHKEDKELVYNNFLKNYPSATLAQQQQVKKWRNETAYKVALDKKQYAETARLYKSYKSDYQELTPKYFRLLELRMFEFFIAEKSWAMFYGFADLYPENPYIKEERNALTYIKLQKAGGIPEFQEYTENNRQSLYFYLAEVRLMEMTLQSNNILHYDYFVRNHSDAQNIGQLWKRFYEVYKTARGEKSILNFEKQYPKFPFQDLLEADKKKLNKVLDKPLRDKVLKYQGVLEMLDLIRQSPQSPWIPELEATFYAALQKENISIACKYFLEYYPKSKWKAEVEALYYKAYTKDGELSSLEAILKSSPDLKAKKEVQEDLIIAREGAQLKLHQNYIPGMFKSFDAYIKKAAPKERAFVALQRMLMYNLHQHNFEGALATLEDYQSYFGDKNKNYNQLLALLKRNETPVTKRSLGNAINTSAEEYMPVLTLDEQTLYFCRMDPNHKEENIFFSKNEGGKWSKPKALEALNTISNHEAVVSVSPDHQTLLLFKEGDLYAAKRTKFGWQKEMPLSKQINTKDRESDACFTADGQALLFTSSSKQVIDHYNPRPKDYHGAKSGNTDLFISLKDKNGTWGKPTNLGHHINTPYSERSPFLHPDMKTLYFSSDGYGGMGKLDVYKSTRLDDSWTNWSTPVNLGKYINTPYDDWGYKITANGKKAFFAFTADRFESSDLYEVQLPSALGANEVVTIRGTILNKDGEAVSADIIWEDMDTGLEVGRIRTNGSNGEFLIKLPKNKNYSYFVYNKEYFPFSRPVNLKKYKKSNFDINENITLVRIKDLTKNQQSLPLENLFFKSNSVEIPAQAIPELKRVAHLLNYHILTVFIIGHTDNKGAQDKNEKLALDRATSVRDFLVKQGCNPRRIFIYGKGSRQPKNNNNNKKGRSQNRRVELIFED
jgi:outer membrane protein OmpA-like peptidoglycan-associated protein